MSQWSKTPRNCSHVCRAISIIPAPTNRRPTPLNAEEREQISIRVCYELDRFICRCISWLDPNCKICLLKSFCIHHHARLMASHPLLHHSPVYLSPPHAAAGWCMLSSWSPLQCHKRRRTPEGQSMKMCLGYQLKQHNLQLYIKNLPSIFFHSPLTPVHIIFWLSSLWQYVNRITQHTYKSLFFILGPKPVASWEEGVRICCIEPLKVTQIHTEPDLNQTKIQSMSRRVGTVKQPCTATL